MRNPPRILFLTRECPVEVGSGGQIRSYHICKALSETGIVKVVVASQWSLKEDDLECVRNEFDLVASVKLKRSRSRGLVGRLIHEFDSFATNTYGVEADEGDRSKVKELISQHDLIWFHTLFVCNSFGIRSHSNSVLDVDDLQSQIQLTSLSLAKGSLNRLNLRRRWLLWRRREKRLLARFCSLCVCSEEDRRTLGGGERIHVIPNGFDPPQHELKKSPAFPQRIGFIGTFRYAPNFDGVNWFIKEVWPQVKRENPSVRLRLVGSGSELTDGLDVDGLGWIDDPSEEIATWSFMIVPVLIGGGTRIKIAEAFSRACPIVSTHLGAFGYELVNGEEALLATEATHFANACVKLLGDQDLQVKLAQRGWERFQGQLEWKTIRKRVQQVLQSTKPMSS
ncbi:MAG: glycosyltransferase family 4 protein [Verrucomicrobia bacterium]|nr:glycosyltransferase family 4 protein [Verrucomicrobiota bacterium]